MADQKHTTTPGSRPPDDPPRGLAKLLPAIEEVRLGAGTAAENVIFKHIPDAELGKARREQLKEFGERYGRDRHAAAKEEHKPWTREAQRIWRINRHLSIRPRPN